MLLSQVHNGPTSMIVHQHKSFSAGGTAPTTTNNTGRNDSATVVQDITGQTEKW
jgi:hypothetical protein